MKTTSLLAFALIFAAAEGVAAAPIYRCDSPQGTSYQEFPCEAAAMGGATRLPTSFPEYNKEERDRILAREAQLDERMLRRAALDSAERISRNDSAAREREAEAQLAMAEAMSMSAYGVPAGWVRPHAQHRLTASKHQPFH